MNKKKSKLPFILILAAILIIILGVYYFISPEKGTAAQITNSEALDTTFDKQAAIQDLQYITKQVKDKHVTTSNELTVLVQQQYDKEVENLPDNPTTLDIWRAGSRIVAPLHDSYTRLSYVGGVDTELSGGFIKNDNGLFYIDQDGKTYHVTKLGGLTPDELYNNFIAAFSYDNGNYALNNFHSYLKKPVTLSFLGAKVSDTSVDIETEENGKVDTKTLTFSEAAQKQTEDPFSYSIDEDKSLGILTINICSDSDEYKNTLKEFFTKVKDNNIKHVALDLRDNPGGNTDVIGQFMSYLNIDKYKQYNIQARYLNAVINMNSLYVSNNKDKNLAFSGDLYVLTATKTYDAAVKFAVTLRDNNLCKVIGMQPGSKPSTFGDMLQFQLPNSKLMFTTTYKFYERPDITKNGDETLVPDMLINSDKALDSVYDQIKN